MPQTHQPSPGTKTDESWHELLSFTVGGQDFCLPVANVREIRTWSAPTPLPLHDPALIGVINLRGTVLPVLDLATALGLSTALGTTQRPVIIVIEAASRRAGLVVDRVRDILTLPSDAVEPPPALANGPAQTCLAALALSDGKFLRILDPLRILPDTSAEDA